MRGGGKRGRGEVVRKGNTIYENGNAFIFGIIGEQNISNRITFLFLEYAV